MGVLYRLLSCTSLLGSCFRGNPKLAEKQQKIEPTKYKMLSAVSHTVSTAVYIVWTLNRGVYEGPSL